MCCFYMSKFIFNFIKGSRKKSSFKVISLKEGQGMASALPPPPPPINGTAIKTTFFDFMQNSHRKRSKYITYFMDVKIIIFI